MVICHYELRLQLCRYRYKNSTFPLDCLSSVPFATPSEGIEDLMTKTQP